MIIPMFLLILFLTSVTSYRVDDSGTLKEDFELERHLKLINKPSIKSIQTNFGYIVDCVDIKKQPTFDHPLLKNHKLQMRPSFYSSENININISSTKTRFELEKVSCPKGFVPIRRTTREDLIRAKSLAKRYLHRAEVYLKHKPGEYYYGIMGTTSVYNPKCNFDQSSMSGVYVRTEERGAINEISVGWHVDPTINGNNLTHAFAMWTSDSYQKTGCYNLRCQGFIQINRQYHIGAVVPKTSVYGGDIVEMPINIVQDGRSKNWWITIFGKLIGYFPQRIFNNLKEADKMGWGGGALAFGAPSPPMGSGHLPDENFKHACYFKNIGYKNGTNSIYYGPESDVAESYHDTPVCFGVDYYAKRKISYGYSLQFGGPGGKCDGQSIFY